MRSVEARGATVEEATKLALEELGLSEEEVTVEVLSEKGRGLFAGSKKVHVRVTPNEAVDAADDGDAEEATTAPAEEAPDAAPQRAEPAADSGEAELSAEDQLAQLDEEADLAADFVEGLLDHLDLPGDIEIQVDEDTAVVTVQDVGSGLLIGRRGATLDALQELVRSAVQRQTERRAHVRVDVEGYRARQIEKLRDRCREAIAEVRETSEAVHLEAMDAYERKLMHDLVARTGGVESSSEGSEPRRHVVIHPAD